jgi:hypothetical protein
MSKSLLNFHVQISKVLPNSKNKLKFKKNSFEFWPGSGFGPAVARLRPLAGALEHQSGRRPSSGELGSPVHGMSMDLWTWSTSFLRENNSKINNSR